jgi:hypothetical protein
MNSGWQHNQFGVHYCRPTPILGLPIFARIMRAWTMIFVSYDRRQIKVGLYSISRMLNNHLLAPFLPPRGCLSK